MAVHVVKLYQLDTGWGCGGVTVVNDVIITAPPIFRKLIGKNVNWLSGSYKVEFVCTVDEEEDVESDFF